MAYHLKYSLKLPSYDFLKHFLYPLLNLCCFFIISLIMNLLQNLLILYLNHFLNFLEILCFLLIIVSIILKSFFFLCQKNDDFYKFLYIQYNLLFISFIKFLLHIVLHLLLNNLCKIL